MEKKQRVLKTLDKEKTGYIPIIPSATSFALGKSPYGVKECRKDPAKYAEAIVTARQKYGYDGLWGGAFQGVVSYIGSGLIDKQGKISQTGEGTIKAYDDLKKLKKFNIDDCAPLNNILDNISLMKKMEPDEPIIVIADNPSMSAAALMDGANYYYNLVKDPSFVEEVTEMLMEPIASSILRIIEAGCDVIWLPLPTIGGTCISRNHYEKYCVPYNKRFNKIIKDTGAKLVVHTCGRWNDRFDIAFNEGADALHIAEADLKKVKSQFGRNAAIMGQLPAVFTMMMKEPEEVYNEALESCLIAAVGGGYILSPDCGMPAATPDENIYAMIRAAREAEKMLGDRC